MAPALFAAELTARHGHDPAEHYRGLCDAFGEVFFDRAEPPASAQQKKTLAKLSPGQLKADTLAGATLPEVLDHAPGNDAPIGGIKVVADRGRSAALPWRTQDTSKISCDTFSSRTTTPALPPEAPGTGAAAPA